MKLKFNAKIVFGMSFGKLAVKPKFEQSKVFETILHRDVGDDDVAKKKLHHYLISY